MKELNLKHEAKRYGCAVLAATIMALNIKTFVRAGGLFPGGFTGLTLLLQNIFQTFMPYRVLLARSWNKALQNLSGGSP